MLYIEDVSVRFGGITALDSLSFSVRENEICALIGPNGAGKTTLFNVISRVYRPSSGAVRFAGADLLGARRHQICGLGVGRTFQDLALWPTMTVRDNVLVGAHTQAVTSFLRSMLWSRRGEAALRERADAVLAELALSDVADEPATGLPFGTLKRVELARALLSGPRLLLLDEPAGGLTSHEVDELGSLIRRVQERHGLTIVLVEHHMGMVMTLSNHVVVLDSGRKIAEGTPDDVRADPGVVAAYLGAQVA